MKIKGKLKKQKEMNDLRGSAGSRRYHLKKISGQMRQVDTWNKILLGKENESLRA